VHAGGRTACRQRIGQRKPIAYLTGEAWLQGFRFFVDERVIVPRSLIAELLVGGGIDYWLGATTRKVLDLCTGNASLAMHCGRRSTRTWWWMAADYLARRAGRGRASTCSGAGLGSASPCCTSRRRSRRCPAATT